MFKKHFNTILIVLIVTLTTVGLITQRFSAENHQSAFVGNVEYARGEIVQSGNEFVEMSFGSATIWLDRNTEVKIVNGVANEELINVIQGRVVIIGDIDIQTREIITRINGITSFVHYSWEDKIHVVDISGNFSRSYSLNTLNPTDQEEIVFTHEESSAAGFYEHVLK